MSTRSKRSAAAAVAVETPSKVAKLTNGAAPPTKKAKSKQIWEVLHRGWAWGVALDCMGTCGCGFLPAMPVR